MENSQSKKNKLVTSLLSDLSDMYGWNKPVTAKMFAKSPFVTPRKRIIGKTEEENSLAEKRADTYIKRKAARNSTLWSVPKTGVRKFNKI